MIALEEWDGLITENKTDHTFKVGKSVIEFFSADAEGPTHRRPARPRGNKSSHKSRGHSSSPAHRHSDTPRGTRSRGSSDCTHGHGSSTPPAKIVAAVIVPMLHVSGTAALGDDAAMVRGYSTEYSAVAVQSVMNIHPPAGVMHVAHVAFGADAHRAAAPGDALAASLGAGPPLDRRRIGGAAGMRAGCGRPRTFAGHQAWSS